MPNLPAGDSEMFAEYAIESHILHILENSANVSGPRP